MSIDLVDPQLRDLIDMFPKFDLDNNLALAREQVGMMDEPEENYRTAEVDIEWVAVPGVHGSHDARVVIYTPARQKGPLPVYLNLHGGGFVVGSALINGRDNNALAGKLGCVIVSVDFHNAPEHAAPVALGQAYAALAWIHANAQARGYDTLRLAVGGDSAGGCLAASLTLLARDRGEYPIAFQLLIGPMLDDRTVARAPTGDEREHFVWSYTTNRTAWRMYLGVEAGSAEVPAYSVPGRTTDFAGLPPAYVGVGALDLFLDEDIAYARGLAKAGVAVTLQVFPGAFHGFERHPVADVACHIRAEAERALADALK